MFTVYLKGLFTLSQSLAERLYCSHLCDFTHQCMTRKLPLILILCALHCVLMFFQLRQSFHYERADNGTMFRKGHMILFQQRSVLQYSALACHSQLKALRIEQVYLSENKCAQILVMLTCCSVFPTTIAGTLPQNSAF